MIDLDREDFRLWLAAKDPDELVTEPWRMKGTGCPAANWLADRTGEWYFVCSDGVFIKNWPTAESFVGTAEWLGRFVRGFDAMRRIGTRDWGESTAKHALTILDEVSS